MSKVNIARVWDVSMPKMQVSIDGKTVIIKHHSQTLVDISEGNHLVQVKCGGFSSSQEIDIKANQTLYIASIIPNWYYCVFLFTLLIIALLLLLVPNSFRYAGIMLLVVLIIHLYISLRIKQKYFKIIVK